MLAGSAEGLFRAGELGETGKAALLWGLFQGNLSSNVLGAALGMHWSPDDLQLPEAEQKRRLLATRYTAAD